MFFYDAQLGLWINDAPLLVSSKVIETAKSLGINIQWNKDGFVCGIDHASSMRLADALGSVTLSIAQFMPLAIRQPLVEYSKFAEWLSDCFRGKDGITLDMHGDTVYETIARPAWFKLHDVDSRGLPTNLHLNCTPDTWKFWTVGSNDSFIRGAIRSYVTSSGSCSLDLGIPIYATHPNLMIREAYYGAPAATSCPLDRTWDQYLSLVQCQCRNDAAIETFITSFTAKQLDHGASIDKLVEERNRERCYDLLGKRRVLNGDYSGLKIIDIEDVQRTLSDASQGAASSVVFGHPHPDADSLVSAVFEAARRTLLHPTDPCLAWAEDIPIEVKTMLGATLTDTMRNTRPQRHHGVILVDCQSSPVVDGRYMSLGCEQNDIQSTPGKESPRDSVIDDGEHFSLVQQDSGPQSLALVRGVIDHHLPNDDKSYPKYVATSCEVSWSSTLQVYFKYLGCGYDLGPAAARVLLEATMLEAEPELMETMPKTDRLAMQRLRDIAAPAKSYGGLMGIMTDDTLNTPESMFYKDYKQSNFGFAVIKCRRRRDYRILAHQNNEQHHLPSTVVKQVVYNDDFTSVVLEKINLVFGNRYHDDGVRNGVLDVILQACKAFHSSGKVEQCAESIEVQNCTVQTPRLLLMPLIHRLVEESLRFAYSDHLQCYLACGFYCGDTNGKLYGSPAEASRVQARLSYNMAKQLLANADNTSFLTLQEYWIAYKELSSRAEVMKSLTDFTYVELLNTEIFDSISTSPTIKSRHEMTSRPIEPARPANLRPEDIGADGWPTKLISPDTYGDNTLWRYWSPDADHSVATRGHIFVLERPCIDLKIKPDESTARLTFRPTYKSIPPIKYVVEPDGEKWVKLTVYPRLFGIHEKCDVG